MSNGLTANIPVSTNSHHDDKDDQERKGNTLEIQMHPEYGMVVGIGMCLSYAHQDDSVFIDIIT
jgi:hypothetical protein